MRSFWRSATVALQSHADWREQLDAKNRRQGTSAPTLAAVWGGPIELFGVLSGQPTLAGFVIEEAVVEAQSRVDSYSGPRNHDLVLRGRLPSGDRVVVCVEAKAGEPFGATLAEQRKAAAVASSKNPASNAEARLAGLVKRFVPAGHPVDRTDGLRYQLLTALAGTLSEAKAFGAQHAVVMVHNFITDERPEDAAGQHDEDLRAFCTIVFGVEPPAAGLDPWSIHLGVLEDEPQISLYLARVVTDLRTVTLEQPADGTT